MLKRKYYRPGLFLLLFLLLSYHSFPHPQSIKPFDIKSEWLTWEKEKNLYVPYNNSSKTKSIHFWITNKFAVGNLYLELPANSFVYINQKVWKYSKSFSTIIVSRDSLMPLNKDFLVSISLSNPYQGDLATKWIPNNGNLMNAKIKSYFVEFNIVSIIIILCLVALTRLFYPVVFVEAYSLQRAVSQRTRDEVILRSKFNTSHNWVLILLFSLITSLLIIVITSINPKFLNIETIQSTSFYSLFVKWLFITFIIGSLSFLKWIFLFNLSTLFKLQEFRHIQFFNSLRLSLIIVSLGLFVVELLTIGLNISNPTTYFTIGTIIIVLIALRWVLLLMKLINFSSHTFIHLFSYLCGTEIIPILIGLKIVLIKG